MPGKHCSCLVRRYWGYHKQVPKIVVDFHPSKSDNCGYSLCCMTCTVDSSLKIMFAMQSNRCKISAHNLLRATVTVSFSSCIAVNLYGSLKQAQVEDSRNTPGRFCRTVNKALPQTRRFLYGLLNTRFQRNTCHS